MSYFQKIFTSWLLWKSSFHCSIILTHKIFYFYNYYYYYYYYYYRSSSSSCCCYFCCGRLLLFYQRYSIWLFWNPRSQHYINAMKFLSLSVMMAYMVVFQKVVQLFIHGGVSNGCSTIHTWWCFKGLLHYSYKSDTRTAQHPVLFSCKFKTIW